MEVRGHRVAFQGFPGYTVVKLRRVLDSIMRSIYEDGIPYCYNVVVLSVGSNDLCNNKLSCEQFVEDLTNLTQMLVTRLGVAKVIVCQIMHRSQHHPHHMRGMTLSEYNSRVDNVNALLAAQLSVLESAIFWRHHRSCLGPSHLASDGVHFNSRGLAGYRRSIYYALKSHSDVI